LTADHVPLQRLLTALFVFFLCFPFFILIWQAGRSDWAPIDVPTTVSVFWFTALQAFLSAAFTLGLGLILSYGFNRLPQHPGLLLLVILPSAVPTLLVVLAAMQLSSSFKGLFGIVFVHTWINLGVTVITISNLTYNRLGRLSDLAWVEGSSRWFFFRRAVWPSLKTDLFRVFLFIFALCFSSFAVPLVLGGSRATTVEVLIYEKIRIEAAWGTAVSLAAMQTVVILFLALLVSPNTSSTHHSTETTNGFRALLSAPGISGLNFFPGIVLIGSLLFGLGSVWSELFSVLSPQINWMQLIAGSVLTGTVTGLLTALLLLILAWIRPSSWLERFLMSFVAPSSVLIGFALLIVWPATGIASLLKIAIGLSLMFTPAFYRLSWSGVIKSLEPQIQMARVLGASHLLIFLRIILPNVMGPLMFLAGLASFWAWGDYALSSVIAEGNLTLAMLAQALMGSYRLSIATAVVLIVTFGGLISFFLFWGVGRVLGAKP